MKRNELEHLKEWFANYCRQFYGDNAEDNRNYALKEEHTRRVCVNIDFLATSLELAEHDRLTAEAVALFHDAGRFEQYRRYKTFRDSDSVNHAALGVKVLADERLLANLPQAERRTVFRAVFFHNAFRLPDTIDERERVFVRMIRDADKLDIWEIFAEYSELPEEQRASAMGLGLPALPKCSAEVVACLRRQEMVRLSMLKSLNDFMLLQLSWMFDLNFPAAFRLALERDVVGRLTARLPQDADVSGALQLVRDYMERRAGAKWH
jgi:hypothetical protein